MTFLTNLTVTEILCSFRLVLEWKTVIEIPESSKLEFWEKFLTNNFALSDAQGNNSRALNREGIVNLPLLKTLLVIHQKYWQLNFWEVILFWFISICMFGNFKNPFPIITSLSELYFRFRRFTLLVQTKKVISISCGSSRGSWKPWRWMRFDLIFMTKDKYISSNLNPLKNALVAELASLFPPVEHLSNDHEDNSNQHRNNHKLCNEI